jgi:SSS family solute:Na+ symporter
VFWIIFDAMTATVGLYARAILPPLDQPVMAYPMLAEHLLPPVAKGLFVVGLLATIMSTLNTLAFVSGTTFGRDIVERLRQRRREGQIDDSGIGGEDRSGNEKTWIQIGLLTSGILAVVLALAIPSVVKLWYTIGTVIVPGLLVPLVSTYFERLRVSARTGFWAMLLGWLTRRSAARRMDASAWCGGVLSVRHRADVSGAGGELRGVGMGKAGSILT